MAEIRAVMLDFDGVLAESSTAKLSAFEDLFALYPAYRGAMMNYHLANYSKPRMAKFEYYVYDLLRRPGDVNVVQTMAERFSEFVVHRVIACPDVAGTREFLGEFSHKVPLYISSVTPQSELEKIIHARRIECFFVEVFDDPPWKKSDAIGAVLKRENVLPCEIIVVGDSAVDYHIAVEAGVEFVGRDSGLRFNGIDIKLYRDLYEIANVIRDRLSG